MQAAGVVLDIAWVEVVGDVEDYDTGARLLVQKWNLEALKHRRIQREKCRKAGMVARADEIETIVDERERKPRSNFEGRHDADLERHFDFSISKEPMWRVKRQRPVLIWPHHQDGHVAEEIICRVQAAPGARPNISNVPIMKALAVVEGDRLKFVVPGNTAAFEH